MKDFKKITRYNINMQKPTGFLNIKNEQSKQFNLQQNQKKSILKRNIIQEGKGL